MLKLAAANDKKQIVLGLEPTGHYWFCLAGWLVSNGISVVQVNPYAVKQTKELEDNSQLKDDSKDPKLIANLVKDGNYGMPYLPEGLYAELRRLSMFRDQLTEDRIRNLNRLHREMKIHFPEYKDALGKVDGAFALELLKEAPFPSDLKLLGTEGIRDVWHAAKLRGRGYSRAKEILEYAEHSVGRMDGAETAKEAVRWLAEEILRLDGKLAEIEDKLHEKCREIPHAENILEISGIGENILSGIMAERGDRSRFDDAAEIQKLSGLGLVACSSGKHKGETKISYRGRKRLRYWLFQAAKSAVAHSPEFKELHLSSTGMTVISYPCSFSHSRGAETAACSKDVVMMCFPCLQLAYAVPTRAQLSDSVPPEVKKISFSCTFRVLAMADAASFTYRSASTPFKCMADGLP